MDTFELSETLRMFLVQRGADGVAAATLCFYKGELALLVQHVGDKSVSKLTLQDGQAWVLHLQKRNKYVGHPCHKEQSQPISKSTLRGYVKAIKVFSAYLYNEDSTAENVFAQMKMPKDTKRVVELLSDEEIRRIGLCALNP